MCGVSCSGSSSVSCLSGPSQLKNIFALLFCAARAYCNLDARVEWNATSSATNSRAKALLLQSSVNATSDSSSCRFGINVNGLLNCVRWLVRVPTATRAVHALLAEDTDQPQTWRRIRNDAHASCEIGSSEYLLLAENACSFGSAAGNCWDGVQSIYTGKYRVAEFVCTQLVAPPFKIR